MVRRIDAHIHLFQPGFFADRPGSELDTYTAVRERHDVAAALVVGYEGLPRFVGNNGQILALAAEHDWIRPLAYVAADRPPVPGLAGRLVAAGFTGWASYLPDAGPTLSGWPCDELNELATTAGILSLNATPAGLVHATLALDRLRERPVLISHLGGPGAALAAGGEVSTVLAPVLALAQHPRTMVKLSGLYAIDPDYPHLGARPVVAAIAEAFGVDRLVWGSDFSPALAAVTEDQLMAIPPWLTELFAPSELEAILGGNLDRFLDQLPDLLRPTPIVHTTGRP
jgi:L-fuconolactonase